MRTLFARFVDGEGLLVGMLGVNHDKVFWHGHQPLKDGNAQIGEWRLRGTQVPHSCHDHLATGDSEQFSTGDKGIPPRVSLEWRSAS